MARYPGRLVRPCTGLLLLLAVGCGQPAAPTPVVARVEREPEAPPEASEIELFDPKVKYRDEETVMMEVQYRYLKGGPHPGRFYEVRISFPGTKNGGIKMMYGAEFRKEGGTIKDGWTLAKPGAKSFEMYLVEGPIQQGPWEKISNVVSGEIQK